MEEWSPVSSHSGEACRRRRREGGRHASGATSISMNCAAQDGGGAAGVQPDLLFTSYEPQKDDVSDGAAVGVSYRHHLHLHHGQGRRRRRRRRRCAALWHLQHGRWPQAAVRHCRRSSLAAYSSSLRRERRRKGRPARSSAISTFAQPQAAAALPVAAVGDDATSTSIDADGTRPAPGVSFQTGNWPRLGQYLDIRGHHVKCTQSTPIKKIKVGLACVHTPNMAHVLFSSNSWCNP